MSIERRSFVGALPAAEAKGLAPASPRALRTVAEAACPARATTASDTTITVKTTTGLTP